MDAPHREGFGPGLGVSATGEGTSCPASQIEVFSDYDGQGRFYEFSTYNDMGGSFSFFPAETLFRYPRVTLTRTDASGNTSEFSEPAASGCLFGYLPIVMKRY